MDGKCNAVTRAGKSCKGKPVPGRSYCMAHDPEYAEQRTEGQRKGGEARANARRAAKQWAAVGEAMPSADLPSVLKAMIFRVESGQMEPSQATAILNLAKAAVTLTNEIELEERIRKLEEAAGLAQDPPGNVRRIA